MVVLKNVLIRYKPKFDESVKLKIIELVINNPIKVSKILNMSFKIISVKFLQLELFTIS